MKELIQYIPSWVKLTFWCFIASCLFFFLQKEYAYYFFYIEQCQLFSFTLDSLSKSLHQIQGFTFYIAKFITQFYRLPYIGAIGTTLLFLIGSLTSYLILKKLYPPFNYYITATLPMILLLYLQLETSFYLGGTIAFLLMLGFLYFYLCLPNAYIQIVASIAFPIILFWLAGPVATLFVLGVIIWVLFSKKQHKYWCLLCIPTLGTLSFLSVYWAWQSEYQKIILTDTFYSDLFLATTDFTFLYCTWFTFPLLLFIIGLFSNKIHINNKWLIIVTSIQLVIIVSLIWGTIEKQKDPILLENMKQDYFLRSSDWKGIIANFSHEKYDLQTLNILNLALIQEDKLDNDLFKYPQHGGVSLLSESSEKEYNLIALSELHYHIGNIGTAQRYAYEGYIISQGGNPRLLKRLVETNLIFGYYPVAEKYITLLEGTLFYREWAQAQRKFLNNDQLIEADPIYGGKRKGIKKDDNITVSLDFKQAFEQIAVNNPDNPIPLYYLTMIHLLNKDLAAFNTLYEKYYHTNVWPALTLRQQEAVIAWYEGERHLWIEKGISFKVEQRFIAYKEQIQNQSPYVNLEKQMASSFGDTFWYYLLFKK